MESLTNRVKKTGLQNIFIRAHLLEKRCESTELTITDLMQAEFVLYLHDALNYILNNNIYRHIYHPVTLCLSQIYYPPFDIFARSESSQYFDEMKIIFNNFSKEDINQLFSAIQNREVEGPKYDSWPIDLNQYMDYEKIATKP